MTRHAIFDAALASAYSSPSQRIRVLSEHWTHANLYCPQCGAEPLRRSPNNKPASDFVCRRCEEVYELKSKHGPFGRKLADGAYSTMIRRLAERDNPSLILLSYAGQPPGVISISVIPKHFLNSFLVEKRRPLATTARRAGWTGCNIVLGNIPQAGRITVYDAASFRAKEEVMENWRRTAFLQEAHDRAQGWLIQVMKVIERLAKDTFSLADVYAHESWFKEQHPENNHVKPKIRQQLQYLRDAGYLEFVDRGLYRLRHGRA